MSREELTPFSCTVLVLVGQDGAGPHDLVRMARQGRVYANVAESRYYAEPKALAKRGYLKARTEPGKTRERTHYTLTKKGRAALREWVERPMPLPRLQHEGIARLLAADLVGEKPVLAGLRVLRDEIADVFGRLDVAEAMAETLPHRRKYLLLNHRLARRIMQANLDWLDEVERDLR